MTFEIGCYGKLPTHGDFIRHRADDPEIAELDQWFQEGLVHLKEAMAGEGTAAFDASPPGGFLYLSPQTGGAVCGAFVPGHDKTGRRFPFLIFTRLSAEAVGQHGHLIPLAFSDFIGAALTEATEGWKEWDPTAFTPRIDALAFDADLESAASGYVSWTAKLTNGDMWTAALDGRNGTSHLLVQNAVELLGTDIAPKLVLQLPISGHPYQVSLWLDFCLRLNGGAWPPRLVFWNGGEHGKVRILFDDAIGRYFTPLLMPQVQDRRLCDLASDGIDDDGWASQAVEKYGSLLDDADRPLGEVLAALRAMGCG